MVFLGYDRIKVKCPWGLQTLKDLEINIEPNQHATVRFTGIVDDQTGVSGIEKKVEHDQIQVVEVDENGKEKILFTAEVLDVDIKEENGIYKIEANGVSGTFYLDIEKKSRSFQNTSMTYKELIKQVIKDTPKSSVIFEAGEKDSIAVPLVQYRESDWTFIKRMASHFGAVVVPEVTDISPRFWFGMPQGKEQEISSDVEYKAYKDIDRFMEMGGGKKGYRPEDFFYYEIKTGEAYNIGDKVTFKNKNMIISSQKARMENGLWTYTYILGFKAGFGLKKQYNHIISGMSIKGKVLATQGEKVKVHLDIDKIQNKKTAYWYKYIPPTGNTMYCMPKIGTEVALYFSNEKEESAKVIGCVRTNGSQCPGTADPNNRYLTTEHNKQMALLPGQVSFTAIGNEASPLKITMQDALFSGQQAQGGAEEGIKFESHKPIFITAKGKIEVSADKKIRINAPIDIRMFQMHNQTAFSMENEFNALGNKGELKGSKFKDYDPINDVPKEKAFDSGKFWMNVLASVAVVVVVTAAIAFAGPLLGWGLGILTAKIATACAWGSFIGGGVMVFTTAREDWNDGEVRERREYYAKTVQGVVTGAIAAIPGGKFLKFQLVEGAFKTAMITGFGGGLLGQGSHDLVMWKFSEWKEYAGSTFSTMLGNAGGWIFSKGLGRFGKIFTVEDVIKGGAKEGVKEAVRTPSRQATKQALRNFATKMSISEGKLLKELGAEGINAAKRMVQEDPKVLMRAFPKNVKEVWKIEGATRIVEALFGGTTNLIPGAPEEMEDKFQRIMQYEKERQEEIRKQEEKQSMESEEQQLQFVPAEKLQYIPN